MSRNTLRYGSLRELQDLLEERPPKDMDEVRAALMNLVDQVRVLDQQYTCLAERVNEIAPVIR